MIDFNQAGVMGVLNCTPDSFYASSRIQSLDALRQRVSERQAAGASLLDIGAESSRPQAIPLSLDEELARLMPCIEIIKAETDLPFSVDTYEPQVMQAAIAEGCALINDIRALQEDQALAVVAKAELPVCLMHMQGLPSSMQAAPHYSDVVLEVKTFLQKRIEACLAAGIEKKNIILDPGFGFGKTLTHNMQLIDQLDEIVDMGFPVLIGVSRKASIGEVLACLPEDRLYGSLALTALAIDRGARWIRSHDVKATCDVLKMCRTLQEKRHER